MWEFRSNLLHLAYSLYSEGYCPTIIVPEVVLTILLPSQANLRYRELNDALENVQEKLRDARVRYCVCVLKLHMWQSRVESEHYSVAYFDRIAAFEAL